METIRNIYCVGRNYALHAHELNNEIPTAPFLFAKPSHALAQADGGEILLPADRGPVHFEVELVIQIARDYEQGKSVDELVERMALGIDFTLRDVQSELKRKGLPWLLAKGFPNSAVLTKFVPFPGVESCNAVDFSLKKNGEHVQRGNIKDMIFDLQTIVDFSARHFGLGRGDIIFTGTPAGVGPVESGERLELLWGEEVLGACTIKRG
ncbi:fumarylacetoacetate hydrolase family protein [Brevibacillus humidisoli]|uniref:fumarylacetoacetate hydrolase family protein n=1 Tax=Brevibacillus humidisoli TaxID=2895522 RepID=UPI001E45E18E|nr:fumarylacetoacetate hydrolase family protein [Brevibacillus humidisoli]UFJ38968.1 fumarylacetoacetate hydrolase family protein [Brevibacillus humidisoli]